MSKNTDTKLTDYRTAINLEEQEKFDEAYERMQRLAPDDRPGYPSAHYWMAMRLIDGKFVDSPEEGRARAKLHLDHLQQLGVEDPNLSLMRAIWSSVSSVLGVSFSRRSMASS